MKKAISNIYILIGIFILLISCNEEGDSIDPAIIGVWSDTNVNYSFFEDNNYGVKFLKTGPVGINDTVTVDSIFGTYNVDTEDKRIIFNREGHINIEGDTIHQKYSTPVWNYEITREDTNQVMIIETSTFITKLTKVK